MMPTGLKHPQHLAHLHQAARPQVHRSHYLVWVVGCRRVGIVTGTRRSTRHSVFLSNIVRQKDAPISVGKATNVVRLVTYFSVLGKVDLQRFCIVLESGGGHGEQDVLSIDRLSFLLLTLLRG